LLPNRLNDALGYIFFTISLNAGWGLQRCRWFDPRWSRTELPMTAPLPTMMSKA